MEDLRSRIASFWAKEAEEYPHWTVFMNSPRIEKYANLLRAIPAKRGDPVLALGCGAGFDLFLWNRLHAGCVLCGIDVSPRLLADATREADALGLHLDLRVASAEAMPFPGDHFQAVFSRASFHHFVDKERALAEVSRILRVGGHCGLEFFNIPHDYFGAIAYEQVTGQPLVSPRLDIQSLEDVRDLSDRVGLRVEMVESEPGWETNLSDEVLEFDETVAGYEISDLSPKERRRFKEVRRKVAHDRLAQQGEVFIGSIFRMLVVKD